MPDPVNRDWIRRSERQVRAQLIAWDPIGVADAPEAADEYDCMIGPVMHKLYAGAAVGELGQWIVRERVEHFGLEPDPGTDRELAEQLTRSSLSGVPSVNDGIPAPLLRSRRTARFGRTVLPS